MGPRRPLIADFTPELPCGRSDRLVTRKIDQRAFHAGERQHEFEATVRQSLWHVAIEFGCADVIFRQRRQEPRHQVGVRLLVVAQALRNTVRSQHRL
jgi:hypothetical protein